MAIKMITIKRERSLPVSPEKAWQSVRDFGGAHKWFPRMPEAHLTGNPETPGTERIARKGTEQEVVERLVSIDEKGLCLSYTITKAPFFIANHLATISINKQEDGTSSVVWTAAFETNNDATTDEVEKMMTSAFETGLKGLEELLTETDES
jgi:hypothetical protein